MNNYYRWAAPNQDAAAGAPPARRGVARWDLAGGVWLIIVYWVTIGLTVMILGAHQFHLKVAAFAAANPGSAVTIGELISKRHEYRVLQDEVDALQAEQKQKKLDFEKNARELIIAEGQGRIVTDALWIAAEQFASSVLVSKLESAKSDGQAPTALPEDFRKGRAEDLVSWARPSARTAESKSLYEAYVKAREKSAAAQLAYGWARAQEHSLGKRLEVIALELPAASDRLDTFVKKLSARATGSDPSRSGNGPGVLGLLYELDSFSNLWFFWLGQIDPLKIVTLPGSVLTLLLALSMGALGSTLYVTGEYFGAGNGRPFVWYIFRPFLGMITALAVFVAFKAGQLTISGVSTNSGTEMDLNPFLVSFFAVIAGLLSEHAIARLSLAGRDWLDRIGKEEEEQRPKDDADSPTPPAKPLFAKEWPAKFAADGKSLEGFVTALQVDLARVNAWMAGQEAVPVEFHEAIEKYFGRPKDELLEAKE